MAMIPFPRERFVGRPSLDHLPGRHEYILNQKPDKWFGYHTRDGIWLVPRDGLQTDQGSVPQIFWWLIPSDAYWAFYIHDDLYKYGRVRMFEMDHDGKPIISVISDEFFVTRDQADEWLFEMMLVENSQYKRQGRMRDVKHFLDAWITYRKVRRWGYIPWNKHNDGRTKSKIHLI